MSTKLAWHKSFAHWTFHIKLITLLTALMHFVRDTLLPSVVLDGEHSLLGGCVVQDKGFVEVFWCESIVVDSILHSSHVLGEHGRVHCIAGGVVSEHLGVLHATQQEMLCQHFSAGVVSCKAR